MLSKVLKERMVPAKGCWGRAFQVEETASTKALGWKCGRKWGREMTGPGHIGSIGHDEEFEFSAQHRGHATQC